MAAPGEAAEGAAAAAVQDKAGNGQDRHEDAHDGANDDAHVCSVAAFVCGRKPRGSWLGQH